MKHIEYNKVTSTYRLITTICNGVSEGEDITKDQAFSIMTPSTRITIDKYTNYFYL